MTTTTRTVSEQEILPLQPDLCGGGGRRHTFPRHTSPPHIRFFRHPVHVHALTLSHYTRIFQYHPPPRPLHRRRREPFAVSDSLHPQHHFSLTTMVELFSCRWFYSHWDWYELEQAQK